MPDQEIKELIENGPFRGITPDYRGLALKYKVETEMPVSAINHVLAEELAGLVIYIAEIIPFVGQTFTYHGIKFEVRGRRKNQITKIKITTPKKKG